ncbi:MAG: Chromosome segregation protein SMC [Oscillospiraceae bacterium]
MSLFQVLPSTFFSVLASPNKEIYADALMLLHQMFQYDVNVELNDYIIRLTSLLEDRELLPETDENEPETASAWNTNQKARFILNKLIKAGWVDKEFKDGTFTEVIVLHDYSIKILKLLENLSHPTTQEYNSLVFSTYSSLKQAKQEEPQQMYDALLAAKENTERLIDELKSLYHNIRDYHRKINFADNPNELLKEHFDDYKSLIDHIYHPIKTMDSVYRYSRPISNILNDILSDDGLIEQMISRAMTVSLYPNQSTAHEAILSDIDFILESYRSIGGLVDEIDRKHNAYTRSSIEKIEYLLTADRTIKGKLVSILQQYAAADENQKQNVLKLLQANIRVCRQENFNGKSLYHKNVRSRRTGEKPLKVKGNNAETAKTAMLAMVNQIKDSYPAARVKAYMSTLLKDKHTLKMEDIPIHDDSDFILLMLGTIRSNDRNMPYRMELGTGEIQKNGYTVPNVTFIHKEV